MNADVITSFTSDYSLSIRFACKINKLFGGGAQRVFLDYWLGKQELPSFYA